jgi:hypothetical protein
MSTLSRQCVESDDEFESADEGEPVPISMKKSSHSLTCDTMKSSIEIKSVPMGLNQEAVTDGWDDWTPDDGSSTDKLTTTSPRIIVDKDSISSLSLPSKTGNTHRLGSDDDERNDPSEQQKLLQRKKHRKKPIESNLVKEENRCNTRISRPQERHDNDLLSLSNNKHYVKDTHHLLDRLAEQSPTRTVIAIIHMSYT